MYFKGVWPTTKIPRKGQSTIELPPYNFIAWRLIRVIFLGYLESYVDLFGKRCEIRSILGEETLTFDTVKGLIMLILKNSSLAGGQ
jgi:hypothetical protein